MDILYTTLYEINYVYDHNQVVSVRTIYAINDYALNNIRVKCILVYILIKDCTQRFLFNYIKII